MISPAVSLPSGNLSKNRNPDSMYKYFFWMILLNFVATCPVYSGNDIEVTGSWINEAPPTVKVLAGYMMICNSSDNPVDLVAVTSEDFERVEFHLTTMKDGIASMEKQERITIPA